MDEPTISDMTYEAWGMLGLLHREKVTIRLDECGFTIWLFNIAMENGPFSQWFTVPIKNGDVPWLC
jgi:hypothetical protein